MKLADYLSLTENVIQRLSSLIQLFPNTFNEKLCEQLLQHLKRWLETAIIKSKGKQTTSISITIIYVLKNLNQ